MLHGIPKLGRKRHLVIPGVWLGTPKILNKALALPPGDHRFKVITGYAGWAPGQLEGEISQAVWDLHEATPELIFDTDANELWGKVRPLGPSFSVN